MNWANSWAQIDVNSKDALTGVSTLDGVTPVRVAVDPATGAILVSSTGGGFSQFVLAATGTVNGVNTQFTFTQEPVYVVSDGAWYAATDNNGNTQWTWNSGTNTLTMVVPPVTSIFGVM